MSTLAQGIAPLTLDQALSLLSVPAKDVKQSQFVKNLGKDTFSSCTLALDSGESANVWIKNPAKDGVPGVVWASLETVQALASQAAQRKGVGAAQAREFGRGVIGFTVFENASQIGIPVDNGKIMVLPVPPDLRDLSSEGRDLFRRIIRHEAGHVKSGRSEDAARGNELHGHEKTYFNNVQVTEFLNNHRGPALPRELEGILSPYGISPVGGPRIPDFHMNGTRDSLTATQLIGYAKQSYSDALAAMGQLGAIDLDTHRERLTELRRQRASQRKQGWRGLLQSFLDAMGFEGEEIARESAITNNLQRQFDAILKTRDTELKNAIARVRQAAEKFDAPRPNWFDLRLWTIATRLHEQDR